MSSLLSQVESVPAGSLEFYPGNARRGDVGMIADSLRENQQYAPLVVQKSTRYVLAGNHTLKAALSLGWGTVDVVFVDVDDARARKIVLSSNRTADAATYDDGDLAALLQGLDGDYAGTGWDEDDLTVLLGEDDDLPAGGGGSDDASPDPPDDPVSAPGDLWRVGPHRLLVGDCTDMAAVEKMLDGDRADCMWTDPPYGVSYQNFTTVEQAKKAKRRTDSLLVSNDLAEDLPGLLAGAFAVATAALKPGAAVYVAHPAGALHKAFMDAWFAAGWKYHEGLVWDKGSMVIGHSDYHYRHEPIMYGYTAGEGRRGRGGAGWYGDNSQTSVFEVPKPSRSEEHPTMKPVSLVTAMLANSCPRKGLVYEPFGGSGTTLIAAHELGMRAAACEIDPRYADVILRRLEAVSGIVPERVREDGTTEPVSFA